MAQKDNTICWANSKSYGESDIVIVGIPNQSHSHSIRKGTALAPNAVRIASNKRDVYVEKKINQSHILIQVKATQRFSITEILHEKILQKLLQNLPKIPKSQ